MLDVVAVNNRKSRYQQKNKTEVKQRNNTIREARENTDCLFYRTFEADVAIDVECIKILDDFISLTVTSSSPHHLNATILT